MTQYIIKASGHQSRKPKSVTVKGSDKDSAWLAAQCESKTSYGKVIRKLEDQGYSIIEVQKVYERVQRVYLEVGQMARTVVAEALKAAGFKFDSLGYADSSSTSWGFYVYERSIEEVETIAWSVTGWAHVEASR